MMYDLRGNLPLLYDFYIVAKAMSFSKAATENSVSQPNLSRNVQALEESLKLKLFNRSNKGIELTLDGEKLYKELDEVFNRFKDSSLYNKNESNELVGNITIGTTRNISDNRLLKYLSSFYQKYPKVKVKILTDSATNLNDYLINHKIDVLIDYLPNNNSTEKFDMEVRTIGEFKTYFATSFPLYDNEVNRFDKIKTLNDIKGYKLVLPGASRRRQLLDNFLQLNNIELNPIIEMPDSKLMADFIKHNNCIGYFVEEEIESYGLSKIELDVELPTNPIGIIYSKNTVNKIAKKFIELVLENTEN